MADVWAQLATFAVRVERFDQAADAYKHVVALRPSDPTPYIGAATTLLKLRKFDEAREHAELAAEVATERDHRSKASAHETLARIALARHETEAARQEAGLAREADPALPVPSYIEGRLLYDQGKYDEALPLFQQAIEDLKKSRSLQMTDLHFYTADTLSRLERFPEAEAEFIEELKLFPQDARARAGLAMLYESTGRADAASQMLTDMLMITPTPDTYALASRIFTMFGNRQQADAIRAQARRTFAETARPGAHDARQ